MTDKAEAAAGGEDSSAVSVRPEGIAILGSHPATKALAPFDQPWLIYACSPCNTPYGFSKGAGPLPRVDAWFEAHIPLFDRTRPYPYLGWIAQQQNVPVIYMRDHVAMAMQMEGKPLFPNAVPYPEKEVHDEFGPFNWTSSIAFQMAKAILDIEAGLAGRQLGLWGIMQASQNEYTTQRPGIQNMIWEAVKRKIKVIAPQESHLFDPQPENF